MRLTLIQLFNELPINDKKLILNFLIKNTDLVTFNRLFNVIFNKSDIKTMFELMKKQNDYNDFINLYLLDKDNRLLIKYLIDKDLIIEVFKRKRSFNMHVLDMVLATLSTKKDIILEHINQIKLNTELVDLLKNLTITPSWLKEVL